jgi:DNA-binding transcriptional ArsR family regulator
MKFMSARAARVSPLPDGLVEEVAQRFRALSEPIRLRILRALLERECSVNEVTAAIGAGQSNVSRHLQALFEAGLLTRRREGNTVYYAIGDPILVDLCHLVCDSARRFAKVKLARLRQIK